MNRNKFAEHLKLNSDFSQEWHRSFSFGTFSAKELYKMIPIYFRGNVIGIVMFVISGLVAGVGGLILKLDNSLVMSMVGLSLVAMDLIIRFRSRANEGWLRQKQFGGYLYFAPVWVVGVVVIAANIINAIL